VGEGKPLAGGGGGGGGADGNFATLHAISLRPDSSRNTKSAGAGPVEDAVVEMCSVSLPPNISRPDILLVDVSQPTSGGNGGPVAIVGSTVSAPAFAAVSLIGGGSGSSVGDGDGDGDGDGIGIDGNGNGDGIDGDDDGDGIGGGDGGDVGAQLKVLGCAPLDVGSGGGGGGGSGPRLKSATAWPFGSSHMSGWVLTSQPKVERCSLVPA
jgi:hypothetical protein